MISLIKLLLSLHILRLYDYLIILKLVLLIVLGHIFIELDLLLLVILQKVLHLIILSSIFDEIVLLSNKIDGLIVFFLQGKVGTIGSGGGLAIWYFEIIFVLLLEDVSSFIAIDSG